MRASDGGEPAQRFRRLGPYLQLDAGGPWLDVRAVTVVDAVVDAVVDETETADGGQRVVLGGLGLALSCAGPLHDVVTALAQAGEAYVREVAHEEEVGRLMALDAQGVPPGEAPTSAGWDSLDRPWG